MIRRAVVAGLLGLGLGAATPVPWEIVRDASTIELTVRAFGVPQRGRFGDWRGDIVFDPSAPGQTRATVVVQADSLRMWSAGLTRRATGSVMLDAARHPTIRFELRGLESIGGDRYSARADITMKGRTRPVTFPLDLRVTGDRAHLTGAIVLDRTDFGIGTSGAWNRMVGRHVTVRVALQARRV